MTLPSLILLAVLPGIGVAAVFAFVRLARGPSLPDRVIALDFLALMVIAGAAAFSIAVDEKAFLYVAVVLALISFIGTVAFAFYIQRERSRMREAVVLLLLALGTFFSLMGALGLVRFPDLYARLSATSKAATLGAGSFLLAVAVHFGGAAVIGISLATIAFLFLTMPVAAHVIARAAYEKNVPLWEGTLCDERREFLQKEDAEGEGKRNGGIKSKALHADNFGYPQR